MPTQRCAAYTQPISLLAEDVYAILCRQANSCSHTGARLTTASITSGLARSSRSTPARENDKHELTMTARLYDPRYSRDKLKTNMAKPEKAVVIAMEVCRMRWTSASPYRYSHRVVAYALVEPKAAPSKREEMCRWIEDLLPRKEVSRTKPPPARSKASSSSASWQGGGVDSPRRRWCEEAKLGEQGRWGGRRRWDSRR